MPGERHGPDAGPLGLEVPQAQSSALRAAPGGSAACSASRSSPPSIARAHRLDRGRDALDRLAVARIGHAFAAPDGAAVGDRRVDHDRLGPRAARDGEVAGDRKALDRDVRAHRDASLLDASRVNRGLDLRQQRRGITTPSKGAGQARLGA